MESSSRRSALWPLVLLAFTGAAGSTLVPKLVVEGAKGEPLLPGLASNVVGWTDSLTEYDLADWVTVPANLGTVRQVAAGDLHGAALLADGTVRAWGRIQSGYDQDGYPAYVPIKVPAGLANIKAIAAGTSHLVALRENGAVIAWGDNSSEQINVPRGLSGVVSIVASGGHTLALKGDGTLVGWGNPEADQLSPPVDLKDAVGIASSWSYSLAVRRDGTVTSWGYDYRGQTVPPAGMSDVVAVAAANSQSFALQADSQLRIWGDISPGNEAGIEIPSDPGRLTAIAAAVEHFIAIKSDGTLYGVGKMRGERIAGRIPPNLKDVVAVSTGGLLDLAVIRDLRDFGRVNLNTEGAKRLFTLRNPGTAPLSLTSIALMGGQAADFILDKSQAPAAVVPGASATIGLTFRPKALGARRTTLRITTNAPAHPTYDVVLIGTGKANTAPKIIGSTLFVEATSPAGAVPDLASRVEDEGDRSALRLVFSPANGRTFPIGSTVVTVTATDSAGLRSTGSFTVKVRDTTAPVFASVPNDAVVSEDGGQGAIVTYPAAVVTDAVGVTVTYSHPSGSRFPLGMTTVAIHAKDAAGNASTRLFRVEVQRKRLVVEGANGTFLAGLAKPQAVGWGSWARNGTKSLSSVSEVVKVAVGDADALALQADGAVVAWGPNNYSPNTVPAGLSSVLLAAPANLSGMVDVAVGGGHYLALKANGTVVAWGRNDIGQCRVPAGLSGVTRIAAGALHSVALKRDGTVTAWGARGQYALPFAVPAGLTGVVEIAAAGGLTVALLQDGSVVEWWMEDSGQIMLTAPPELRDVTAIATSGGHTLALKRDGTVIAWGFNLYRQTDVPAGLNGVVTIAAGGSRSAAVKRDGTVVHWGRVSGTDGPPELSGVAMIALGAYRSVAVRRNGGIVDWRDDTFARGYLPPLSLANLRSFATGGNHRLRLNADGTVASERVGTTSGPLSAESVPPGLSDVVSVAAAYDHSVALKRDGSVVAWGANFSGAATVPAGLNDVIEISAADNRSFALKRDGTVVAFGGAKTPPGLAHVMAISTSGWAASALTADGSLLEWDSDGHYRSTLWPGFGPFKSIASGPSHLIALTRGGTVIPDVFGLTSLPPNLNDVTAIQAGYGHNLALRSGGGLIAWGNNSSGQATVPAGIANVSSIKASRDDSLAFVQSPRVATARVSTMPTETNVGQSSTPLHFTLHNSGETLVTIRSTTLTGDAAADYRLDATSTLMSLAVGQSTTVAVIFTPSIAGERTATVRVETDALSTGTLELPLSGLGRINTAPVVSVPSSPVVAEAAGPEGAVVSYRWSVTDMGDTALPSTTVSHPSASRFPIGDTTVTIAATDSAGLTTSQSFVVSVRDATPPTFTSLPDVRADATTPGGAAVTYPQSGTADAVGVTSITYTPPSGSLFSVGSRTVTAEAQDAAGNKTTKTFTVTVAPARAKLDFVREGLSSSEIIPNGQVVTWGTFSDPTSVTLAAAPLGLNGVKQIAAGSNHTVALRVDGTVAAWGANNNRQTDIPAGLSDVRLVIAKGDVSAALRHDGTAVAWGQYTLGGPASLPSGLHGVVDVRFGALSLLALKQDGTVIATGSSAYGLTTVPAGLANVVAVDLGDLYAVALKGDGTVVAWGAAALGRIDVPAGLNNVKAISAGGAHTLALKHDGTVVAWGLNSSGQSTVPAGLHDVATIQAVGQSSFAVKTDGTVVAWGQNDRGQSDVPSGLRGITSLAASAHVLAVHDAGHVTAWGANTSSQATVPTGLSDVVAVAAGSSHSTALRRLAKEDYGPVKLGQTAERAVTVASTGVLDVSGLTASIDGPVGHGFEIVSAALPSDLAAGSSASVRIRFSPTIAGTRTATLRINSTNAAMAPLSLTLSGIGAEPDIVIEAANPVDGQVSSYFGVVALKGAPETRTFTLRNVGHWPLEAITLTKDGPNAAEFTVSRLSRSELAAGESQTFTVDFTPSAVGPRYVALHIASNDADEPVLDLELRGDGTGIDISFDNDGTRVTRPGHRIDLGELESGAVVVRTFTLRNTGSDPLRGLSFEIFAQEDQPLSVTPAFPSVLRVGESFTFTVRFSASLSGRSEPTLVLSSSNALETFQGIEFVANVRAANLHVSDAMDRVVKDGPGTSSVVRWSHGFPSEAELDELSGAIAIATFSPGDLEVRRDGKVTGFYGTEVAFESPNLPLPANLDDVFRIAAGYGHLVALRRNGQVVCAGANHANQSVPPVGVTGVVAVAANFWHSAALTWQGKVALWGGGYSYGLGEIPLPPFPSSESFVAISAGHGNLFGIKADGTVSVTGWDKEGLVSVLPPGVVGVAAIASSSNHTLALCQDGTVATLIGNSMVPEGLSGVKSIAVGDEHSVALRHDGSVVSWGVNDGGKNDVPGNLCDVSAVSAGHFYTLALCPGTGDFGSRPLGQTHQQRIVLSNNGNAALRNLRASIVGPDADQFALVTALPSAIAVEGRSEHLLRFRPTRAGPLRAQLQLHSNDPLTPSYPINLTGNGLYSATATKAGTAGSALTYSPIIADRQTGLRLQTLTFTNTTPGTLLGLRVKLRGVLPDVSVLSSSAAAEVLQLDVVYSLPIAAGQTVSFPLSYVDLKRRVGDVLQPSITVEALLEAEPSPGPVSGTKVPLLSVRDTSAGPLLEWTSKLGNVDVVEYSDDGGRTWFSAVHRLGSIGTRMMWVDRGQPETIRKPASKAVRMYRVKRLDPS